MESWLCSIGKYISKAYFLADRIGLESSPMLLRCRPGGGGAWFAGSRQANGLMLVTRIFTRLHDDLPVSVADVERALDALELASTEEQRWQPADALEPCWALLGSRR